jgi:transcription elongation factor Elf1
MPIIYCCSSEEDPTGLTNLAWGYNWLRATKCNLSCMKHESLSQAVGALSQSGVIVCKMCRCSYDVPTPVNINSIGGADDKRIRITRVVDAYTLRHAKEFANLPHAATFCILQRNSLEIRW